MIKLIIFIVTIIALIIFCITRATSSGNIGKIQKITIWIGIIFLAAMLIASITTLLIKTIENYLL